MNAKAVTKFRKRLDDISNDLFDEDDVKLLLIEIRDYLKNESILREICDFIAHPRRDRGICHSRIDSRFAKQYYAKKRTEELVSEKVFEDNIEKPWSFFSDRILDYLHTDKIEKKLFETVIKNGIDEIDQELFKKHYGLDQEGVRHLIGKYYTLKTGEYVMQDGISEKEFAFVDDLLKFIRGTFTGRSAFEQLEIEQDLRSGIERLVQCYSIDADLYAIDKRLPDLVVCILSILYDTEFVLLNGKKANAYVSVHCDKHSGMFFLCLAVNVENFIFQIISTNIDARKYINGTDSQLKDFDMRPLPWRNLVRGEGSNLTFAAVA